VGYVAREHDIPIGLGINRRNNVGHLAVEEYGFAGPNSDAIRSGIVAVTAIASPPPPPQPSDSASMLLASGRHKPESSPAYLGRGAHFIAPIHLSAIFVHGKLLRI
jgi:hypothetical protein